MAFEEAKFYHHSLSMCWIDYPKNKQPNQALVYRYSYK